MERLIGLEMSRIGYHLSRPFAYANPFLRPYREKVWIIGDGRSGTNWLSQIVNHDQRSRFMYEPFHPTKVNQLKDYQIFQYVSQNAPPHFAASIHSIMNGTFNDARVNYSNRPKLYSRLLVKDIFAHLFAAWAIKVHPELKAVLLLRHPFAVALSKQQRQGWSWMTEPREFLNQAALREDFLQPYTSVIETAESYFEKQVAIWSIIHFVLRRQVKASHCHVVMHEELCRQPGPNARKLAEYIGRKEDAVEQMAQAAIDTCKTPNHTKQDEWAGLSAKDIDRGLQILNAFGLDRVYGESRQPLCDAQAFLANVDG